MNQKSQLSRKVSDRVFGNHSFTMKNHLRQDGKYWTCSLNFFFKKMQVLYGIVNARLFIIVDRFGRLVFSESKSIIWAQLKTYWPENETPRNIGCYREPFTVGYLTLFIVLPKI